ncbi:unnamed protein product, partial [Heterosigma akashiwo]
QVWDAAEILCQYLANEVEEKYWQPYGKSVLELGSGCGLCGIYAAKLGA